MRRNPRQAYHRDGGISVRRPSTEHRALFLSKLVDFPDQIGRRFGIATLFHRNLARFPAFGRIGGVDRIDDSTVLSWPSKQYVDKVNGLLHRMDAISKFDVSRCFARRVEV
jgi:hypothetical protein